MRITGVWMLICLYRCDGLDSAAKTQANISPPGSCTHGKHCIAPYNILLQRALPRRNSRLSACRRSTGKVCFFDAELVVTRNIYRGSRGYMNANIRNLKAKTARLSAEYLDER